MKLITTPVPNGIEERLRQRERLLEDMRYWRTKPDWKQESIRDWKLAAHAVLVELLAYQQAITSIQNSYFEGQQVLFHDVVKDLAEIITIAEGVVDNFNEFFAESMHLCEKIDLEALRQNATKEANRMIAYIVDMAKAEALDCLGDEKAAVKTSRTVSVNGILNNSPFHISIPAARLKYYLRAIG